ncbi:hypothetical protein CEXT_452691 [Caerostris extrusa]|uniref:Uncharacterized protein n=1 Tax=Caerostris extrusa TaxID=172846 RepID=A0AAV4VD89_CAEEX|nr:hypothetical protein CEXT_452691 [Caerostris extrusa]
MLNENLFTAVEKENLIKPTGSISPVHYQYLHPVSPPLGETITGVRTEIRTGVFLDTDFLGDIKEGTDPNIGSGARLLPRVMKFVFVVQCTYRHEIRVKIFNCSALEKASDVFKSRTTFPFDDHWPSRAKRILCSTLRQRASNPFLMSEDKLLPPTFIDYKNESKFRNNKAES